MTNDKKFKTIIERLKIEEANLEPIHISAMVITGYLDDLAKAGLIESAWTVTKSGENIRAVCEEFDWKPSDKDIFAFVSGMVEEKERAAFMLILKKYRDDRAGLLEEFKKSKS